MRVGGRGANNFRIYFCGRPLTCEMQSIHENVQLAIWYEPEQV